MNDVYDKFVSLGENCSISRVLNNLNYRNASYPFDWNTTHFNFILDMFRHDFNVFLEPIDKLEKFGNIFRNSKKNIYFYHDGNYDNLKKNYEGINEKYNRRITNLKNLINSGEKILFIRKDSFIHNSYEYNLRKIDVLYNIIKRKYKKSNFNILFITNSEKYRNYKFKNPIIYLNVKVNSKYLYSNNKYIEEILSKLKIRKKFNSIPLKK